MAERMETLAKRLKRRLDLSEDARAFNKREIQRVSGERNALQGKLNEACAKVRELEAQAEAMKARVAELEIDAADDRKVHEEEKREAAKEALALNGEVKKLQGELATAHQALRTSWVIGLDVRREVGRLCTHLLHLEVESRDAAAKTVAEFARRRMENVEKALRQMPDGVAENPDRCAAKAPDPKARECITGEVFPPGTTVHIVDPKAA